LASKRGFVASYILSASRGEASVTTNDEDVTELVQEVMMSGRRRVRKLSGFKSIVDDTTGMVIFVDQPFLCQTLLAGWLNLSAQHIRFTQATHQSRLVGDKSLACTKTLQVDQVHTEETELCSIQKLVAELSVSLDSVDLEVDIGTCSVSPGSEIYRSTNLQSNNC
jgi:hypothetical protein